MTILLAFRGGTMLKIVICGCDVLDWLNPHFLIEIGLPWVGHIGAMAGRKPRGGYVYRVRAQWRRGHLHERWWET